MAHDDLELDWLAFQYVAGELSTEETARFEERLAVDQQAREAVASAVELAEVAVFVEQRPVELATTKAAGVSRVHWTRRLAWMSCGAAVCLLLMVWIQSSGWNHLVLVEDPGVVSPRLLNVTSPDLALAWAQARFAPSSEEGLAIADSSGADEDRSEQDGIKVDGITEDVLAAPSWMLAAVAGLGFNIEEHDSRRD